jgi:hypothetical protein
MPVVRRVLVLLQAWLCVAQAAACPPAARERYEPRSFLGYACRDDCQRHKSGYDWARRQRARRSAACAALAGPEQEGCLAYVEEPLTPGEAGQLWASENEIADASLCDGAGEEFGSGCRRAVALPSSTGD